MTEIHRTALFGKLNPLAYQAIESATVFCKMRGNPYVELVHWLNQILQLNDSDLHRVVAHFQLDPSCLAKDLTRALDRLPRGATSLQDLSSHVEETVERGWVYASLMFDQSRIRTGHLLIGIVKTRGLQLTLEAMSSEFKKVKQERLVDQFHRIVAASPEKDVSAGPSLSTGPETTETGDVAEAALGRQDALRQFSVDLTEKARNQQIDPIVARDPEIRQIIDILMRRRQNNPILTGEAGVGKTAVVEGFALRIAAGDVPPPLRHVTLRVLDVGLLQAGAGYKGEFEKRLRQVIDEVQTADPPVILFIDEAHTLIGAGGAAGTGDAANLLKPALARGTLRTIAATTWGEYKKYIEKDPALTRRFQPIQIDAPDQANAVTMLRAMAAVMETHHRVQVRDEALVAAVELSHRYIPARQLPDKAISLLDTACARIAISQHGVPARIDDGRKRISALKTEMAIIQGEARVGLDTAQQQEKAANDLASEQQRLEKLEQDWAAEKDLVTAIVDLQERLRTCTGQADASVDKEIMGDHAPTAAVCNEDEEEQWRMQLRTLQSQLHQLQGETPLMLPCVDRQAVAAVVADWTGIPVGRMVKNEIEAVLDLETILNQRILGQDHALKMIARRIRTSRASLDHPGKPIGVFMLAGPSGVGKTETALTLAEALYGGEHNVVTINMSEFQESHTVSTLKGAPPGYVGYGEGGVLTEAVRRKPYSVILLDEVEKAHPDVHEIFFQVFDKGWMEDGQGRLIDFKNTLILLTTNVGSDQIAHQCRQPEQMPDAEALAKTLRPPLRKIFPAALLGRLVVIAYYPLSDTVMNDIVRLQLDRIEKRLQLHHHITLSYGKDVVDHIIRRCTEYESGGRMIDAILTNTVLPRISRNILTGIMEGHPVQHVGIRVDEGAFAYTFE